jgi:hypothetical protein
MPEKKEEFKKLLLQTVEDSAYILSSTEFTGGEIVAVYETVKRAKAPLSINEGVRKKIRLMAEAEKNCLEFLEWGWWWTLMEELKEEGHLYGVGRRENERLRLAARRCLRQIWNAEMLPYLNNKGRKAISYAQNKPQLFKPSEGLVEVWSQLFNNSGTTYAYLNEMG